MISILAQFRDRRFVDGAKTRSTCKLDVDYSRVASGTFPLSLPLLSPLLLPSVMRIAL